VCRQFEQIHVVEVQRSSERGSGACGQDLAGQCVRISAMLLSAIT
jgi:hypothetical protein